MKNMSTRFFLVLILASFAPNIFFAQRTVQAISSFTEPSLSPSGEEIAFVSGGDIWTVASKGGEARLLIANESFESRPLYSPDNKYMAFTSLRTGSGDVYIIKLETGELQRLTFDDGFEEVSGWSGNSSWVFFSSTGKEISGMADVYKVSITGGTPIAVLDEPYTNEFFAVPSSDGSAILFNARGVASRQWWRHGHSHLDESEIWIKKSNGEFSKITDRGAKSLWPMWGKDGGIFYVSDKDGNENLYSQPLSGAATKLTNFSNGRVLWPSMSNDGKTIVFERDLAVWTYDVGTKKAEQIVITKKGAPPMPPSVVSKLSNQFSEMALSPDGKKMAIVVRGEVYAASAKDGGDATRVTNTLEPEEDIIWAGDSKSIIYNATASGKRQLFAFNFNSRSAKKLTDGNFNNEYPSISPDGKSIAYIRDGKELRVLDISTGADRRLTTGYFNRGVVVSNSVEWSPDSKWIAFASSGVKAFRNISIIPAQGGDAKPVSFLPNSFGGRIIWSKNGKYLLYLSRQRTESGQIARINLVPQTPQFTEDRFQSLFNEPSIETKPTVDVKPADKKNVLDSVAEKSKSKSGINIAWGGIQQRMTILPVGLDVSSITLSHDGKTLLLSAPVAGQENFYTWSLDETSREAPVAKQITSSPGGKSNAVFSPDDKDVYFTEQGRVQKVTLESREVKPLDITAEMEIDFQPLRAAVYQQAWEIQRDNFYDTAYHGADWNEARTRYEPYARGAGSPDELRRIIGLMIGELNASHSGIGAPGPNPPSTGRLGLKFDWPSYEITGQLKVKSIITQGPADVVGSIKAGDYIIAIDDTLISSKVNIDRLLLNKINKRVKVRVGTTASFKDSRVVDLRPVNMATEKGLLYREWVAQQRAYVLKASGGRLGYVHMFDMSAESLNQLYLDLDAENHAREGVVVDVRNNNGGFVNAYALDVISRKSYMTMTTRGLPSAPARTQLGQRSLESPTILVINQHSLSDAEDFTEGYKTLQLGKVVGEPTGGWIIYTSGTQLIDGSTLRLPFIRVTDHEGKNMELVPRQPDIKVSRPLGESAKKVDSQLDVAVKELLKSIDDGKSGRK